MIPIKLKMRNFMCYRDDVPPLYLNGIHTACICGDNGNGKSTLIDAMTWAVWGKTRARNDDDLIHSSENEMEVEFEFAVGQQVYRIIRKHAKPRRRHGSGQSSLDLFIASDDGFKVISTERIKQTEQKIKDILHMDYDTFINSAFLRQGHADEFTQQPAGKRKEVLANILGLSLYDELEERAKAQARERETERVHLDNSISEINDELVRKPEYQTELEQVQNELTVIDRIIEEQKSRLDTLRAQKEALERIQAQLNQIEGHISNTERGLRGWEEEIKQRRSRVTEYEALITQRAGIEEGYAQLIQARKVSDELNNKFRQAATLSERRHQLEIIVERAQANLLSEHKLAQNKMKELEIKLQKLPHLKSDLQQVQLQLNQLAGKEESLRRKKQDYQELQKTINFLQSSMAQTESAIKDIEEKLKLLNAQTEAKCPLCESDLGEQGLKVIETKYADENKQKSALLEANKAELSGRKNELESLENEISRLEKGLGEERATAQANNRLFSQQIAEADQASLQLEETSRELAAIEEHLALKDFAPAEQQALRAVETELTALSYDERYHEQIRQELEHLTQHEEPKRKLDEADRLISQEKESISRAEENCLELRRSLESDNQKKQIMTAELASLPQVASDLANIEAEHLSSSATQKQVSERMWGINAKLQRCDEQEARKKEKEKQLTETVKEEQIYRDLAQAFGKGGIQAMIIEIALPEIENEANRLLGRMTDNRMQVKIETQRESKRGSVIETLDINISDEMGLRNYEMFSGGEAFRINFAIRIALSKLLAHRAGAPLPTLIIDEGFGTQDSSGIEKLKEAINSIQDDFDKILVITHIEEFKDAFPARIAVTKTANGSTLEIS